VLKLGADQVIDYTKQDPFVAGDSPYDVVFNTVRGAPLARLRLLLRKGGSLVTITGDHPGQILTSWARNLFSSRSVTDLKTGIVRGQYLAGVSSKRLTALIFSLQGVLRLFRPHIYCGRYFMTVFFELGFNVSGSTSVENDPFM
jgi:hypothetical protein